jgi:hypothetical protein
MMRRRQQRHRRLRWRGRHERGKIAARSPLMRVRRRQLQPRGCRMWSRKESAQLAALKTRRTRRASKGTIEANDGTGLPVELHTPLHRTGLRGDVRMAILLTMALEVPARLSKQSIVYESMGVLRTCRGYYLEVVKHRRPSNTIGGTMITADEIEQTSVAVHCYFIASGLPVACT